MKFLQILENNGISKLYHFTDRENLESIIKNGGLYSWADCRDKGITIAKPGGSQQSRKLDTRDGLQYYVRLSFTSQHPMLFVAKNEGRISDPVILEIDLEVVYWKGTKYADRNATKTGAKVGETLKDFKRIHFQTIKAKKHFDLPEDEQVFYQAEVLVKNFIPLDFITNIGNLGISIPCQSQTTHIISRLTQSITETVSKFGLIHKEMTYEESMNRIREIVALLQKNELPLDEGIKLFEEGLEEVLKCLEIRDLSGLWPEMPSHQRMVSVI